jgi:protein ImuB
VVLEAIGPRGGYVVACSTAAAAQGIRPDMPVAEAKSLARELVIEHHEPLADSQALRKLAEMCEKFSPCVALEEEEEPESLLLDISNLAHLLGSDARLATRVEKFFTRRKYRVQIAVADTIGLAWAVAHFLPVLEPRQKSPLIVPSCDFGMRRRRGDKERGRQGELDITPISLSPSLPVSQSSLITQLPVESLRIAADTADLLRQLGIQTVGQLLVLPRASLSSRFGDGLLRRLDQLTGAAVEVLVPHHGLAALEAGCTLEHPTADRATLVYVLSQLTEQLAGHLAARDQGAVLLVCKLGCANGQPVLLRIGLVEPSASARQMMELIGLYLETVALADEVAQVEIQAAVVGRLGERQHELFVDQWPSDPHQMALLVNRLSSRLGYAQVLRPQLRASPLPERAFRYLPATEKESRGKSREPKNFGFRISDCELKKTNPQSEIPNPQFSARPLLLYPEPRLVEVICVAPDGPPQFIWLSNRRERIVEHWGPERIETLWWQGPSVRRDYYRIATEAAGQWWIFRQLADGGWFLHGIFA